MYKVPKIKTYVDSCVLISAFCGEDDIATKALAILGDPDREFVISDYLKLELLPKPTFHNDQVQLEFLSEFLNNAQHTAPINTDITNKALDLGCRHNLKALDALHISTAIHESVKEFFTFEKPSRPMHSVNEINVIPLNK